MNAPVAKKMISVPGLAALLGLSACAAASVEAPGPLEPRVAALVAENRTYPRWADFPDAPTDVPDPIQIASRVNSLKVASGSLAGEVARIQWLLSDQDAAEYAAAIAARVDATPIAPETRATQADIEAFAQGLRDRGRAPPPIPRR